MDKLQPPETFDFPFTPYTIQHEFMRKLYETLEDEKFGIFESPTGTGKSLSIICGAIRWLKDHNQHERESLEVNIQTLNLEREELTAGSDWLETQSKEIEITRELNKLKLQDEKISSYYKKIQNLKNRKRVKIDRSKYFKTKVEGKKESEIIEKEKEQDDDEDLILNNDNLDLDDSEDEEDVDENKYTPIKIYICSRTHSQLSQFIGEIIKSKFGEDLRVVSLASRQNYCINPAVNRLKVMSLINEKCLDMQKSQSKSTKQDEEGKTVKRQKGSTCKCPYYKQQAIEEVRDSILLDVQDVEDLVTSGKVLKGCPYYSSRMAVEDAEVVLVPYNTILHKATREANGVKLKNNVVIIDEAHNLLEALAQMYGAEVNYEQLHHSLLQLKGYKAKYSTRFSAQNLLCINQLIYVISRLKEELDKNVRDKNSSNAEIFTLQNFVLDAEIDNYNMFKLVKFVRDSKISQKLHSFALRFPEPIEPKKEIKKGIKSFLASIENKSKSEDVALENESTTKRKPPPSNPLLAVISFLEALTYSYDDGRILMHRGEIKKLQFLLLNPSTHFKDLVNEARSIIVAGGTMKPITEFRDRLFINAGVDPSKIIQFSCDHIIPPENILPVIVTSGPSKENFLFNYENRLKMGANLKTTLLDACNSIRGGIVVFFPSYKYEAWFWDQVKDVNFGRPVFREPKESGSVDSVLENYHKAIYKTEKKSALLFSVVGGKLSEGLNFSDDLGRCVIVVGLPYANIYAPDLKEKMSFLDRKEGSGAGNKFYENLCMKAVNQCIGRAVRHKNDYATVLLLDERYNRQSTKNALPDWIKRSLKTCGYADGFKLIRQFFENKSLLQ